MNHEPFDGPVPFLQSGEQRLIKLRKRLETLFEELYLVHDVVMVSVSTLSGQKADYDPEVAHVLVRCGVDKMHGQLKSLSHIVEQLGGVTEFTRQRETGGESPNRIKVELDLHATEHDEDE